MWQLAKVLEHWARSEDFCVVNDKIFEQERLNFCLIKMRSLAYYSCQFTEGCRFLASQSLSGSNSVQQFCTELKVGIDCTSNYLNIWIEDSVLEGKNSLG
eukprot:TRINITY_DN6351_c0_g1_i2.p2 TRINITY_DN6351_c0_g1~~TRINITY_DN6351_c0_g1_i2.p2  ORF type:complete len:100 (+),score=6.12 TRINITY_DN6351_c0_g1_i2:156-455(+)